jgi:hypothetical protein
MTRLLLHPGKLLRGHIDAAGAAMIVRLLGTIVLFGMIYGATMGAFGGRGMQSLYAAVKVPMLLIVTFAISLPSFFVLNSLRGLRGDFGDALQALLATQAGLTIVLASLAPITAFWYVSNNDYDAALAWNTGAFAVASFAGQAWLRRAYRPLIDRNPRHRAMLWAWLGIYAFVGIQLGWVLRPFVGSPTATPQFFRADAWGNAYVHVLGRLFHALHGW